MNTNTGHMVQNIKVAFGAFAVTLLFILFSIESNSQDINKNEIILFGQVTNELNGAPIKNQEILVTSDTINEPNFVYSKKLITDAEGFYYDTISTFKVKGCFILTTKDFENMLHDTIVYYRFNWSENNILEANFSLPIVFVSSFYQANFKYMCNPTGNNNLEYQFNDLTNSSYVISWEWDFGDGFTSTEQNPLHVYSNPGIYRIKLKTVKYSQQSQSSQYSSIVKKVNATIKGYYSMGGQVFAGYFPIDYGAAFLYKIEDGEYLPIDTAEFNDTLGLYYFPQLIEGNYIVKADLTPNSTMFNEFIATYYSDKQYWEEADTIFHYANNYTYDIQLITNEQQSYGPGKVTGTISYGYNQNSNKNMAADNVVILLLDENNQTLDICHSDNDGHFMLENLELNTYKLYAEVTGKYTYPVYFEIDETNATLNIVDIIIGNYNVNGSVNSGINDFNYLEKIVGPVYPNPVTEQLWINVNESGSSLSFELLNHMGQLIQQGKISTRTADSKLTLNTSDLPSGFYFIRISDENNTELTRKFVKH